jgi:excinuclease ABC subunit C
MSESAAAGEAPRRLGGEIRAPRPPARIEVYDNSTSWAPTPVGAFIVSGPNGFEKGQYRKFNIETAKPGDDFGMMKEVLTRRFTRLLKEDPDRESPPGPTSS